MVVGPAASEPPLAGVDLHRWRPWVLVVVGAGPAPAPPQEDRGVLDAGYEFCLFDGASRFYVAAERADSLRAALSYPAHADDDFVPARWHELGQELAALRSAHDEALEELVRGRGAVLARWSDAVGACLGAGGSAGRGSHEVVRLREELAAMQATVSWRVTAPLRALQQRRLRAMAMTVAAEGIAPDATAPEGACSSPERRPAGRPAAATGRRRRGARTRTETDDIPPSRSRSCTAASWSTCTPSGRRTPCGCS